MSRLYGIGPKTAKIILDLVESPEWFFTSKLSDIKRVTGLPITTLSKMKRGLALEEACTIFAKHDRLNVKQLFITDETFPISLKECADAPIILYYKGQSLLQNHRLVAVVGMREPSSYGKNICQALIRQFSNTNIAVVSGLAHGIDTYAHKFCLQYNVPTIAVYGHGHDRVYPATNQELASKINDNGMSISEFPPGTKPDRENFPKRNRIVAGLCDATIVIESRKKGGSLITAGLANGYNREVFSFPGNITSEKSEGCNLLISNQLAHLITSADDFFKIMNWKKAPKVTRSANQTAISDNLTSVEKSIFDLMHGSNSVHLDVISDSLKLSTSELSYSLFQMELNGLIKSMPGKEFSLK
jgi:DNA processing protein